MKSKIKYILLIAVLLILITFVIAGFLTDWYGLYGPVSKIAIAGAKTFGAQNFSADFKVDTGKFYAEGTLQLSIDPDSEIVEANIEVLSGKTTYIAAIYDRKLIYGTKKHLFSKDIQQEIESYFERQKNSNVKIRSIDDALDLVFDLIPADLKDLINEKYLDLNTTKELLPDFLFKKLNRTSWLKEHAGYTSYKVDGIRYYTFRNDKGALLEEFLTHFEKAFVSDSFFNKLKQSAQTMQKYNGTTETLFAVEDGILRKYETITHTAEKTSYFSIEFYSIGNTRIDQLYLKSLLDQAND